MIFGQPASTARIMTALLAALLLAVGSAQQESLTLQPLTEGNVFLSDEEIVIGLETTGESVDWVVHDLWGAPVASGRAPAGGELSLNLPAGELGYFTLSVSALDGERVIARAQSHLAVLPPRDFNSSGDSPFAVQTHFSHFRRNSAPKWDDAAGRYIEPGVPTYGQELVELLVRAGVSQVRDELPWNRIEPASGVYAFAGMYEEYMRALEQAGISTLTLLNYGNKFYDVDENGIGAAPFTDEGRQGYAQYALALLDRYGDTIAGLEAWNEYNAAKAPWNRGPCRADPTCYAEMIAAVDRAVEAEYPDTTLAGPATSGVPLEWLARLFEAGALEHMDAVSVHPYRYPDAPEGMEPDLHELERLVREHSDGEGKSVYLSEIGWPTHQGDRSVSERTQAQFLVRSYALALAAGVEKVFWYDFMNDGANPARVEQNFGVVRHFNDPSGAHTPKPSYVALATMTRQLAGADFDSHEDIPGGVRSYAFASPDEEVRVMWAPQGATVRLETPDPLTVVEAMGRSNSYRPLDSAVVVSLSADPVYVRGRIESVTLQDSVSLDAESVEMNQVIPLRLTWDNRSGAEPVSLEVLVEGERYPAVVEAGELGEVALEVPGRARAGLNTVVATVLVDDDRVARLTTDIEVRDPLSLESVNGGIGDVPAADQSLRLRLTNDSPDNSLTVEAVDWRVGDLTGRQEFGQGIEPGTEVTLEVPLPTLEYFKSYPSEVIVTIEDRTPLRYEGEIGFAPVLRRSLQVDGVPDELDEDLAIDLVRDGRAAGSGHEGAGDLEGNVWLSWDEDALYLSAWIEDDIFEQSGSGEGIYDGDSVQISIAPSDGPETYGYGLALTPAGPEIHRRVAPEGVELGAVEGATLSISQNEGVTVYELALPWTELDAIDPADATARAAVQVNDNDGSGRSGWLEWGAGIGRNTPSTWREVQFIPQR